MVSYSIGFLPTVVFSASRDAPSNREVVLVGWCLALAVSVVAASAGFGFLACAAGIALLGAVNSVFVSQLNTVVQLHSSNEMKGRVMALWTIVLWGTVPIGTPIVGWVAETFDPRISLLLAATATAIGTFYGQMILRRPKSSVSPSRSVSQ